MLLSKIKDEIGNLDQEIIFLQKNLTKAINKRHWCLIFGEQMFNFLLSIKISEFKKN